MAKKVSVDHFKQLEKEFGMYASWLIWGEKAILPTDLINETDDGVMTNLQSDAIFVGLSWADDGVPALRPWESFHAGTRKHDTSWRFQGFIEPTPYVGSYATDLIKDFKSTDGSAVVANASHETKVESCRLFLRELDLIQPSVIYLLGGTTATMLTQLVRDGLLIIPENIAVKQMRHPSAYCEKEMMPKVVEQAVTVELPAVE